MFWKITCSDMNLFSYIIVKHPDNIFERSLNEGRNVKSFFIKEKENLISFVGYNENSSTYFKKLSQEFNLPTYVRVQESCICPHSLKSFDEVFKSILRNKNSGGVSSEDFNKNYYLECIIGPYPEHYELAEEVFKSVNINVKKIEYLNNAFSLHLFYEGKVTDFFQKIYIISYYLTKYYDINKTNNEQLNKFINLSKEWLDKTPFKERIINRLCDNKNQKQLFKNIFIENKDDFEEKEKFKEDISVHRKRHNLIIKNIDKDVKYILELGCGYGQLLKELDDNFSNSERIGVEISSRLSEKSKRNSLSKIVNCNILNPNLKEIKLKPDVLVLTEVIEHLEKNERIKLYSLIKELYVPKKIIITVPNIEYNKFILKDGELRHKDHKIEFSKEDIDNEIINNLSSMFNFEIVEFEPKENISLSWILIGNNKNEFYNDLQPNKKLIRENLDLYSSFYLPISNYEIRSKEITKGLISPVYTKNINNIFYLAPTMSPVEYTDKTEYNANRYLEHPLSAFDYYKSKGIDFLYGEKKYMGSRSYILCFKDNKTSKEFGYDYPLIINSRKGWPFFDDDKFMKELWNRLQINMKKLNIDFIIMEAEITPWNLKAEKLIKNEFLIPGECYLIDNTNKFYIENTKYNFNKMSNGYNYLNSLQEYTKDEDTQIHLFNILAYGNIKNNKFININFSIFQHRQNIYSVLREFNDDIFSCVDYHEIDFYGEHDFQNSIELWDEFCSKNGGEGFVYKPNKMVLYDKNGYLIQPSVKVRGLNYLRLIYGFDYLDENVFEILKNRRIKRKRILAIQEHEIGINILRSFLNRNKTQTEKFIASFIGFDNINYKSIDATL